MVLNMITRNDKKNKYQFISSQIAKRIETGVYNPGDKLPGSQELAKTYDTSILTIRQAVNELIKNKLVFPVQGKGTFVSEKIDQRDKEELSVQLVICSVHESIETDPFGNILLMNLCSYATSKNTSVNVTLLARHQSINDYLAKGVTKTMRNGLIMILNSQVLTEKTLKMLIAERIPFVVVPVEYTENLPQVRSNGEHAVREAIKTLHQMGHENILLLPGHNSLNDVIKVYDELGLELNSSYLIPVTPWDEESTRQVIRRVLKRKLEFTAVYTSGDNALIGVCRELMENGIKIPDDVSVFCHDRYSWLDTLFPFKLSGYQQNQQGIARALLDFVEEQRQSGMSIIKDIQIPMDFVAGSSCFINTDGFSKFLNKKIDKYNK